MKKHHELEKSAKLQVSLIMQRCIDENNLSYREMATALNEILYPCGAEVSHTSIGHWLNKRFLPNITPFYILSDVKFDGANGSDWRLLLGRDIAPILLDHRERVHRLDNKYEI